MQGFTSTFTYTYINTYHTFAIFLYRSVTVTGLDEAQPKREECPGKRSGRSIAHGASWLVSLVWLRRWSGSLDFPGTMANQ